MAPPTETIPLFPLDVVLFPGMVLPLHIFENRYRKMVRDCMISGESFGLVWTDKEPITLSPERPLVGTKAMMTEVVPLPDGRFNINTVGSERFVVRHLSHQEPYLLGEVVPYPSLGGKSAAAHACLPSLTRLFQRYLKLLSQVAEQPVALNPMPDDPVTMAFAIAILYQGQNWRKQRLLAIESIPDLLRAEAALLRVENPLIQRILALREADRLPPLVNGSLAAYSPN